MDYFVRTSGGYEHTRPMETNDLTLLGLHDPDYDRHIPRGMFFLGLCRSTSNKREVTCKIQELNSPYFSLIMMVPAYVFVKQLEKSVQAPL